MGTYNAYWGALSIVLACVIVCATLWTSRRNYWISVFCFALLAIGTCSFSVFPAIFSIFIAEPFEPRPIALSSYVLAYIGPILSVCWFAYSALSLFPFLAGRASFWIVTSITGLAAFYSLGLFVAGQIRFPMNAGPPPYQGIQAIYYWLLWMRVYELRKTIYPLLPRSKNLAEQAAT